MLAELQFVLLGVVYQLLSIVFESARITLVQILIQRKGLRLNPITARLFNRQDHCICRYLPSRSHQVPTGAGKACARRGLT